MSATTLSNLDSPALPSLSLVEDIANNIVDRFDGLVKPLGSRPGVADRTVSTSVLAFADATRKLCNALLTGVVR